jgi:sialic acid synthase SpsE
MFHFSLNGASIDIVKKNVYLGVLFSGNGRFCKAIKSLANQANRAMFAVFKIIRQLDMPIDCQLKLFDQVIQPVLLYGSEVWGFENTVLLERVQLKFCKINTFLM